MRLVYKEDSKTIRLRDDGKPFDPVKWIEYHKEGNPAYGYGIRMVTRLAKSVHYLASMEMNNLTIQI